MERYFIIGGLMFGDKLKELLTMTGKNQQTISSDLGLNRQRFNLYVNNKREPNFETLITIAKYFNVSIDYLLDNQIPENKMDNNIKKIFNDTNLIDENGSWTETGIEVISEFIKNNKDMITAKAQILKKQ